VEHNARMIAKALELDEHERPITSLPLHYSYGLSVLNSHLAQRACLVLTDEPLTSKSFWDIFRRERCTSMAGVPYTYQILRRLELDKLGLPSLSTLTQAGGKLDVNLVKHFSDIMSRRGGRFFVMYGQTEATARIAVLPASLVSSKPEAAGRVLCEGELRIEANGVALPPGQIGEVTYRGVNVMMGYAENREDLMRGDELGGELRTGDLGYLDEEGVLFITGRSKRIAKVFGLRINLEEVEAMLRVHGDTAVLGATDQLIIYCEYGDEEFFSACRRMVAEKLKIHHQAFVFKRVELLPRNANGKIDYQRLQREV
jgi:acyl-CoA synthetase (AMP-forming)/AMP-acid ligase II